MAEKKKRRRVVDKRREQVEGDREKKVRGMGRK